MERTDIVRELVKSYTGPFVEIGVDRGDFSEFLLSKTDCSKLYCVDPYTRYKEYNDAINNVTGDTLFTKTKDRLSRFGERVEFVRRFSAEAAGQFSDESVDMVYIDGNHSYEYVMEDLKLWFFKVRKGGVLIGDDVVDIDDSKRGLDENVYIQWAENCFGVYGVYKALRDFCAQNNLQYEIIANQFVIRK